ncbi:unnamed protein product, partial [Cylicostephanus goldi]
KCAVVTICSESSVPDEQFRRLVSVADTVITLETHEGACVADIMTYKKNGKHANMKETFNISEDMKISSKKFVPSESLQAQLSNSRLEDLDIEPELGEKERDAKQNLNLPYTSVAKQSDKTIISSSRFTAAFYAQVWPKLAEASVKRGLSLLFGK